MTIEITKAETEALINQRLRSGGFSDAEDVILQALKSSRPVQPEAQEERIAAIERLKTFGKNPRALPGRHDDSAVAP